MGPDPARRPDQVQSEPRCNRDAAHPACQKIRPRGRAVRPGLSRSRPAAASAGRSRPPRAPDQVAEPGNAFPLQFTACEFRKQTRIYSRLRCRGVPVRTSRSPPWPRRRRPPSPLRAAREMPLLPGRQRTAPARRPSLLPARKPGAKGCRWWWWWRRARARWCVCGRGVQRNRPFLACSDGPPATRMSDLDECLG